VVEKLQQLVVQVEGAGGFIQRINHNAGRRNLLYTSPTAVQGVHQEQPSQSPTVGAFADGQSSKKSRRNQRIARQAPGDFRRERTKADTVRGKSVIAENVALRTDQNERCGDVSPRVLSRLTVEVFIELRHARRKSRAVVEFAQWFDSKFGFGRQASPPRKRLAIFLSRTPQDWPGSRRSQERSGERFTLARSQHQEGTFLNGAPGHGFGAVQDEVGH